MRYKGKAVTSSVQGRVPLAVRGASNNLANRPNSTGISAKPYNPTSDRWFDTAQFVNSPLFTYGKVSSSAPKCSRRLC